MVEFIGLCCLVFLFAVGAEPIQDIKRMFDVADDSDYKNPYQYFILKLLNCSLCSGFWIGLIFYQSWLMAGCVSIASEILTRIINKL